MPAYSDLLETVKIVIAKMNVPEIYEAVVISFDGQYARVSMNGTATTARVEVQKGITPAVNERALVAKLPRTNRMVMVGSYSGQIAGKQINRGFSIIAPPNNVAAAGHVGIIEVIWDYPVMLDVLFEVQVNDDDSEDGNETTIAHTKGAQLAWWPGDTATHYFRVRSIDHDRRQSGWSDWVSAAADADGSGEFYQIVAVDDIDQTQRGKFDLIAGTGITLTPTDNSVDDRTEVVIDATGSSPVSTASNIGGGAEWFKDLSATILRFRTFISSHLGLVITQNADDITIDLDESEIDHNSLDNLTTADPHTQYVLKSLFDANTILKADSDDTPVALSVPSSRIVARLAAGNIVAATVAEIKTLLAYVFTDIPGTLGLTKGGTNADLSATGPGALVQASSGANVTVETLAATRGGTGQSTVTTGDTLYGSASNVWSKLAAGTNGFFYKMVAGIPAWAQLVVADISNIATTYANVALSNLAGVAINTSLISDTDNTDDLGSSAIKWRNIFANRATLEEVSAPSAPTSGDLITWADVLHNLNIISSLGMISKLLLGEVAASFNATLNTTPVVIFTRTIKANAGGTKGRLRTEIRALILNNSGASRTYTFSYKFDTYTATFVVSLAANATQRTHVEFCIETFWDQAQNAQIHIFMVNNRGPAPAATFGANTNQGTWGTSAITTSGDITVSVELVSNSATATQSGAGVVVQSGPNNN